jgi:hypothetical protein
MLESTAVDEPSAESDEATLLRPEFTDEMAEDVTSDSLDSALDKPITEAFTAETAEEVTNDWLPRVELIAATESEMSVWLRLMRCTTELRLWATMLETDVLTSVSELLIWLCVELTADRDELMTETAEDVIPD